MDGEIFPGFFFGKRGNFALSTERGKEFRKTRKIGMEAASFPADFREKKKIPLFPPFFLIKAMSKTLQKTFSGNGNGNNTKLTGCL